MLKISEWAQQEKDSSNLRECPPNLNNKEKRLGEKNEQSLRDM